MRKEKILGLLLAVIVFYGFTFPWEAQPKKKEENSTKREEIQELKPEKVNSGQNPDGVLKQEPGVVNQAVTQPMSVPVVPKIEKLPATRIQPIQPVQPIQPLDPTANVQRIQTQINEIIRLQESLKQTQQGQLSEIQRIIDQAKIHQRILDDIKLAKASRERINTAAADQLLQQEKVRLIGKETEQNKKLLEDLAKGGSATPPAVDIKKTEKSQTGLKP